MKKILLAAVVALASFTAKAQVWVGGNVGFGVANVSDVDVTLFTILPEIGYKLNDNWDLAIKIGDEYTKVEDEDAANAFVVNPYARYTFYKTGKVGFFLNMGFGIKTGDFYDSNFGKAYADETAWNVSIAPGVKFDASDKVSFVATIGALGYKACGDDHVFGLNVNGNDLQFGCIYNF